MKASIPFSKSAFPISILLVVVLRSSLAFQKLLPCSTSSHSRLVFGQESASALPSTSTPKAKDYSYTPIFDFTNNATVDKFERIDDAIMGGISLSSLKQNSNEDFARWSGICRLDGGGFCGTRTLPFEKPIQVEKAVTGIYLMCKLTSDTEPERRVWKVTTRSEQSRGEQLYQAMFEFGNSTSCDTWSRIEVPFATFQQVRGPRMVEGAAPLNASNGLFQIGLSLSKFKIANNVTEVENFRPGFFELQIKEIGLYSAEKKEEGAVDVEVPKTLSEKEIAKKKPILLKLAFPFFKMLFNEKRRRRESAMRILQNRGMSKFQAMNYGFKIRANTQGALTAASNSILMMTKDGLRALLFWTFRLILIFPIRIISKVTRGVAKSIQSIFRKTKEAQD